MKKLKLFPKIFIYTLALLLLITTLASGTIYLLAPMMGENSVLSEGTYVDGMSSAIKDVYKRQGYAEQPPRDPLHGPHFPGVSESCREQRP